MGGIMNKIIRAVVFFVSIFNVACPMNETFVNSAFLGQNFDNVKIIFCYLDGASFLAVTSVCKLFGLICKEIPTKELKYITGAEAIYHGNVNLTCRYLMQNFGKSDSLLFTPTAIQDIISEKVYDHEIIKLSKIMLGKIGIYKVRYDIDGLNEVCQYMIYIKFNQDYVLLTLSPCQDLRVSQDFGKKLTEEIETHCFMHAPALCAFLNISLMTECEFYGAQCSTQDYFACAICSEAEMVKEDGGNVYLDLIDTQDQVDIQTSTSHPYDRFEHFCLNVMFVLAAQKNHAAVIRVMLNHPKLIDCLQSGALKIAAALSTSPEIKQMINDELEVRKVSCLKITEAENQ